MLQPRRSGLACIGNPMARCKPNKGDQYDDGILVNKLRAPLQHRQQIAAHGTRANNRQAANDADDTSIATEMVATLLLFI